MFGHQVGDKLVAMFTVEFVRILEIHAKKPACDAVPKRRSAGFVDYTAQFGESLVMKTRAVIADEQIAAACNQHAVTAGSFAGVQE